MKHIRMVVKEQSGFFSILLVFLVFMLICGCGKDAKTITYANPSCKHVKDLPANRYNPDTDEFGHEDCAPGMTGRDYERLGDAMYSRGRFFMACVQYEKALALEPETIGVLVKKGMALLAGDKNDEAVEQFNDVLKKNPDSALAYEGLGMAYFKKKDYDRGISNLQRSLELDCGLWKAHNILGTIYDRQERHNLAIQSYKTALKIKPDAGFIYNNLGVSYYLSNDGNRAAMCFHLAINRQYKTKKVYNNLGLALGAMERYEEALDAFKKGGTEAGAYNNLGCICLEQGKLDEAALCFKEAIKIDPAFYVVGSESLKKTNQAKHASQQSVFPLTLKTGE